MTVNSKQLEEAAADLAQAKASGQILILQNNWDIDRKLAPYFAQEDYLLAFPYAYLAILSTFY
nr:hypothetical protein [Streptococcus oricebi]